MNRCQCGDPATRLLRVLNVIPDDDGERRSPWSWERSTSFASCEAHRHQAKEILEREWAMELVGHQVTILMGRRRRAGS